ncbi:sialidase family protein [Arenibacter troitsensis]|uniref:Uncharacterized protein n=1 Tax=Arenibacter troitsensis TaxID=188872 RepID=A0A1X7IH59_9FLAO|nr:sialidase family protein [Arenibacter troitsensis]SMG13568.1 hypothetical protein SAMN03080602_00805 [Arenibacter troitsensis]
MKNYILKVAILFLYIFSTYLWGQQNSSAKQSPVFEINTVFNPQTDNMGYHNYRIPSLFVTKKESVLAIMEGRKDMNHDHANTI